MADADATGHAPDGHVRDRSDEVDNEDVRDRSDEDNNDNDNVTDNDQPHDYDSADESNDSTAPHDYDSDGPPQLGDLDHGRDTLLIVDGTEVAGEFRALADPNAPDFPLAAVRVAPPRAGEGRLHHLTTRYGLAVEILAFAQTQRVIFERRIRDLELLELRRPSRARNHIIARELRYTENEAQVWRLLRRGVGTQRKAAIAALLDLKLECTFDTPALQNPRGVNTYPPFEWVPRGTVVYIIAFRREENSARYLRWKILSIERELIGADAGPVPPPAPGTSVDIREAIAEVTWCNNLHVQNIVTRESARARLRRQVRDANRDVSIYYNSYYGCTWDPVHFVTEIP